MSVSLRIKPAISFEGAPCTAVHPSWSYATVSLPSSRRTRRSWKQRTNEECERPNCRPRHKRCITVPLVGLERTEGGRMIISTINGTAGFGFVERVGRDDGSTERLGTFELSAAKGSTGAMPAALPSRMSLLSSSRP